MNAGIDLRSSFIETLTSLGLPLGVSQAFWIPLPSILMIIGATVGVLVVVWLERKISAAAQQRIGPICRPFRRFTARCRWDEISLQRRCRPR